MARISIEKLFESVGSSVYKLVILVTKRALELVDGSPRLTDAEAWLKPTSVAMKEISEGKVKYKEIKE